jgi:hypothetical protein
MELHTSWECGVLSNPIEADPMDLAQVSREIWANVSHLACECWVSRLAKAFMLLKISSGVTSHVVKSDRMKMRAKKQTTTQARRKTLDHAMTFP